MDYFLVCHEPSFTRNAPLKSEVDFVFPRLIVGMACVFDHCNDAWFGMQGNHSHSGPQVSAILRLVNGYNTF